MLDCAVKVIRSVNFLSEENDSVRFELGLVSGDFLGVLLVAIQDGRGGVALDRNSQSMPFVETQLQFESKSLLPTASV
jgi:hypothetical protein